MPEGLAICRRLSGCSLVVLSYSTPTSASWTVIAPKTSSGVFAILVAPMEGPCPGGVRMHHVRLAPDKRFSGYAKVGYSFATGLDRLKCPRAAGPPSGVGEKMKSHSARRPRCLKVAVSPPRAGGASIPRSPPAPISCDLKTAACARRGSGRGWRLHDYQPICACRGVGASCAGEQRPDRRLVGDRSRQHCIHLRGRRVIE